ncbi:uncharacterized protein MYCFIDRAFT_35833 [Pseudocercospora fijiensis CIRAD86]|uniref:Uncharacterized protein n=1 Tax=Pseudocercospora fijiensis (strain CIRAD86) TaxID=383855 RepID=M2ZVI2_PSEFD|nr:uncharacterized protein MYCFIDRAFT_35833 [Pseudocercospora fijiensis CIRAD86]EME83014.1 hypothetical protein MYCFIDRAFT_35833 [Pseudocercospora fijiensis CIRAD86]
MADVATDSLPATAATATTPTRRVGRPPKYDWADKKDLCYRLYVTEQKSGAEIVKYFAETFRTNPSDIPCKRGFLRQFSLWGFPTHAKKLSQDEEEAVSIRMHELWEQNMSQKDMKLTLANEGWQLKDYEFNKIWRKNGLRLRLGKGYKTAAALGPEPAPEQEEINQDVPLSLPMSTEELARRQQRLFEIQLESDQKMANKKRRRRIRGYSHLPADAPGTAPRYNSETSLDESKAYLHLTNEMYQTIRKDYQAICEEMGIKKKTQCAEGVWEESKAKLIRENMHLINMTHPLQPDQDRKAIALECICADVTKRMRNAVTHLSVAQANNVLGINPATSKMIRRSFYEILAAANFESRLVSGEDEWQALKQQWYDANEILQNAVNEGDTQKTKAIDLLGSDAMKRFREDKNKQGYGAPAQKNARYGPGPGAAWATTIPRSTIVVESPAPRESPRGAQISQPRARAAVESGYPSQPNGNFIGTLAQATGDINFDLDPALATPFVRPAAEPEVLAQPIGSYFRLATNSNLVGHHPKLWLAKLTSKSMAALHKAATSKAGAAKVAQIKGIVKNGDGTEDNWQIDDDDELQAYLDIAGEKPTFVVLIEAGYT